MKGKNMKKVIALLLSLALVLSVAGCGSKDNNNDDDKNNNPDVTQAADPTGNNTTPEPTDEPEEEVGPYTIKTDKDGNPIDLGGINIIIRDWFSKEEREPASDNYTQARYDYWDWAQETYNFTIKEAPVTSWADCIEELVNYNTTGGDNNYYIFHMRTDDAVFSAINNGMCYDVSTLDCLDFTEDKWVHAVTELYGKGDSVYGFRSHNMSNALGGRGMFFNKALLANAGITADDIYGWQRNGEWTWEKYEEVCQLVEQDTDNDGAVDIFAQAGPKSVWFTMSVYSNAANFIGKDANGNFFNDLESNETMQALNWARDMWDRYDSHKGVADDVDWTNVFTTGKAVFAPAELWRAEGFYGEVGDDLGFICYPKGPNATQYANVCSDAAYFLPAIYDEEKAWKIMFAFNLYTADTPGYEGERPWRSGFYKAFGDVESVNETIQTLMDYARPAYDTGVPGASPNDVIDQITENSTPAQAAEAVRARWEELLKDANS